MTTFQHGDIVVHRGRHQYGVYLEPAAPDTAWVMFHGDEPSGIEVSVGQLKPTNLRAADLPTGEPTP